MYIRSPSIKYIYIQNFSPPYLGLSVLTSYHGKAIRSKSSYFSLHILNQFVLFFYEWHDCSFHKYYVRRTKWKTLVKKILPIENRATFASSLFSFYLVVGFVIIKRHFKSAMYTERTPYFRPCLLHPPIRSQLYNLKFTKPRIVLSYIGGILISSRQACFSLYTFRLPRTFHPESSLL